MHHYIDHKDRQGRPRTACGQLAANAWTPCFWSRADFIAFRAPGIGPADRCPACLKVADGRKHQPARSFDEYAGTWAVNSAEGWGRLPSIQHYRQRRAYVQQAIKTADPRSAARMVADLYTLGQTCM